MLRLSILGAVLLICILIFGRAGLIRLSEARFERLYLPPLAFGLQALAIWAGGPLQAALLVSGGLLALFCIYNLRQWPISVAGIGLLLNQLAIIANGGAMPVSAEHAAPYAAMLGVSIEPGTHMPFSKDIVRAAHELRLGFLGDAIVLPNSTIVYSVGDLFIVAGCVCWIVLTMAGPRLRPQFEQGALS